MIRRAAWLVATLLVAVGLYAYFRSPLPRVSLPAQSIQKTLDARFPLSMEVDGSPVSLANPFVDLINGSSRIAFSVTLVVSHAASGRTVPGSVRFSGAVRYDGERRSVQLDNVEVDGLEMAGSGSSIAVPDDESILATLARDICPKLSGLRIHELDPELASGDEPIALREVVVREGGLRLTFGSP